MVKELELFGATNKKSIVNGNKEIGSLLAIKFILIFVGCLFK
jgi:hypothetical protein